MVEAEKLDKSARKTLAAGDFAVPRLRKLPLNDVRHTNLAWDNLDITQGLTRDEKSAARHSIMARAKELGIDTSYWHKVKGTVQIGAMALNISNDGDHPNKMPFSGCLVKLDEESTEAPHGTGGRRIVLSSEAAERALESLLGMAVDFTPAFDGHDAQSKVGIITSANVVGNEIQIAGFIYAADFPEIAASIKALKTVLGFSFEAQDIEVLDPGADVLTITDLAFTGAAILRKDKAAYQTTSLAASAEMEFLDMSPDEMKALFAPMLAEAIKPLSDELAASKTANAELQKAMDAQAAVIQANAAVMQKVEPHASAIEKIASDMEAAGVGAAPNGHAAVLHRMASSMRSEAAMGKVPHVFHDYSAYAAADKSVVDVAAASASVEKKIADAIAAAVAPLSASLKDANDKLAASATQISDLKAGKRLDSTPPERKTLAPAVSAILARAHLAMPEGDAKLARSKVNEVIRGLNVTSEKKIEMKLALEKAGIVDEAA